MKTKLGVIWALPACLLILSPCLSASTLTYTWSQAGTDTHLDGTAAFTIMPDPTSGYDLIIVLTNTSAAAPIVSGDIISGVLFDISADLPQGALTMASATATDGLIQSTDFHHAASLTAGNTICAQGGGQSAPNPSCTSTTGGGWEAAYLSTGFTQSFANGAHYGIGTTGLGIFNGNFVNPADYEIAPGNGVGIGDGANTGVTHDFPFVYGDATFVLTGLTSGNVTISNVRATYGTLPEATPAGTIVQSDTPEPSSWVFFASGIAVISLLSRRAQRVCIARRAA